MDITDPQLQIPAGLRTAEFVLRPITADDAALDHAAVMESRSYLRLWEQSSWPEDDFTVEANREDLVDLEQRHAARRAYTYTLLDPGESRCLGCVYLFPPTATFLARSTVSPLARSTWAEQEAVVYFWTRSSAMDSGLDARLLERLRGWLAGDWGLTRTVFVTHEQFTQQVGLLEATDLAPAFELVEPGKPGKYLVYG
ncbi:N-acetyltransferase [Arthrobacter sp.]|uniref:N-acetyltransferase n=1 Tax=Arthrobacter sp. TaxID=1667 RepID=UPI003A8FAA88